MHVCFIFHREYPATHSTAIQNYATILTDQGHTVSGIFARTGDESECEEINGVTIHRIPSNTSSAVSLKPTIFGWKALKILRGIHRDKPVDVVHLHAFPGLGAIVDTPRWAPPTVVDIRGTAVRNPLFEAASRLGLVVQRRLANETAVISERVAEHIFGSADGLSILPLGANIEAFSKASDDGIKAKLSSSKDELLLGYVGGLHESRELVNLISGFEQVSDRPVRLVIIGDGRDRERLENHVQKTNLSDRVTFTGAVPHTKIPNYLAALDIGLAWIPNKPQYRNQPPLKTVEYLAAGLPVIATPTPGNLEFCSERNALISSFDVDEFARDLEQLVSDEELRGTFSEVATESVEGYDYSNIVRENLIPIYERVLEQSASKEQATSAL